MTGFVATEDTMKEESTFSDKVKYVLFPSSYFVICVWILSILLLTNFCKGLKNHKKMLQLMSPHRLVCIKKKILSYFGVIYEIMWPLSYIPSLHSYNAASGVGFLSRAVDKPTNGIIIKDGSESITVEGLTIEIVVYHCCKLVICPWQPWDMIIEMISQIRIRTGVLEKRNLERQLTKGHQLQIYVGITPRGRNLKQNMIMMLNSY